MNQATLKCLQVTKTYGGLVALDSVNLEVQAGEVFGIIGPNGAGKTTLFDVISGVSTTSSGTLTFEGRDITRLPASQIAVIGLQRTFQTPVTFSDLSVRDNVMVGGYFGGNDQIARNSDLRAQKIEDVLKLCGLQDVGSKMAGQLPVIGRKQLMIATALVSEPTLLMLDEPMGGLNAEEREFILKLLGDLNRSGMTLLIIEHVMSALLSIADRLLILDYGKVIFEGPAKEALEDPKVVQAYFGAEAEILRS